MRKLLLIFLFIFNINLFAQTFSTNGLDKDELSFINYYIKDFSKINQTSDSVKLGYWINYDSLHNVQSICYHEYNSSEYYSKGDISMLKRKDIITNNTDYLIDTVFDNLYNKNIKIRITEEIENLKACFDTSLFFQMDRQRIIIKDDTMIFVKGNNVCSNILTSNDRVNIEINEASIVCSDTKYHNVKVNIDNEYILFNNLLNVKVFSFQEDIYIFSFQNCMNRLRVYRVKLTK